MASPQQRVSYRIEWSSGVMMLLAALAIDTAQFVVSLAVWILLTAISTVATAAIAGGAGFVLGLGVGAAFNFLASAIALALFRTWFFMKGVSFIRNWRILASVTAPALAEIIPFVNNLPWWTIGVWLTIVFSRVEDRRLAAGKKAVRLKSPRVGGALAQKALAATPVLRQFAGARNPKEPPQKASYALNPGSYVRPRPRGSEGPRGETRSGEPRGENPRRSVDGLVGKSGL